MVVSVLELQRARKVLEEFCSRRNAMLSGHATQLRCCPQGDRLLIGETDQIEQTHGSGGFRALLQLSYEAGRWYLFWPQEGGDWRPYPPLPQVDSIQAVIEELEQRPLHVHWA